MSKEKTIKIYFGKEATYTNWGKRGCSRSMYNGGFDIWIYGIKGFFNIRIAHSWGTFCGSKNIHQN